MQSNLSANCWSGCSRLHSALASAVHGLAHSTREHKAVETARTRVVLCAHRSCDASLAAASAPDAALSSASSRARVRSKTRPFTSSGLPVKAISASSSVPIAAFSSRQLCKYTACGFPPGAAGATPSSFIVRGGFARHLGLSQLTFR